MKKKLLFFVSHISFFISHRLQLAKIAKKKGYKVLVAFGELDADTKCLTKSGIDIFHVPTERGGLNFLKDLRSFCLLWSLFVKIKPDIVHLVTIKPYLYGGILARLTKVPCVVSAISGLGSIFIQDNYRNNILKLILYPFYKIAFNHPNQVIIFQNNDDAKFFKNWGVLKKNKIRLIKGSGVDIKKFNHSKEFKSIPVVSFVARLLIDKGIYEFVSAANLIYKRKIKARFLVIGGLDIKNPTGINLEDFNKLKKYKNIEVLGYQKDISKLYSKSHIICLPSYREGFPKSLIEAAAAGRAVITTNVPGCKDSVIPNKTGLLIPAKNSKKLADAIQFLIENPKKRVQMGKAGRKLAEKEFKVEKIIQKHLDIYKALIKTKII
tara:strand:- start:5139 stop:6278 length:1140 start_codon:yes stop_codon:yes gene_type:complete